MIVADRLRYATEIKHEEPPLLLQPTTVLEQLRHIYLLTYCKLVKTHTLLLPLLQPFNGLFPGTAWVSQYQKGKTSLDLNEARDDGVLGCSGISWMLFLAPNQQCQSTGRHLCRPLTKC